MAYSILDLKNDLGGVLHGTTVNQIQNLDGVINRAARQLLLDIDPQETKRIVEFVNPIFNSVFDYPIAADVKGNKLIDIFPQVQRIPQDIWLQAYNQAFDVMKQNIFSMQNMFTINFNTSIKTVRINAPFLNPPIIVNQIDSITNNGTWALAGNASNLTVNNTNFVQGSGSLQFDATTGFSNIGNASMTPVDLSLYVNQASLFVWVYAPTGADLASVMLTFGSSGGDYSGSVTQNQQGVSFVNGWNLCQFDWDSMTVNGSPDPTAINYAEIQIDLLNNATAFKVNGFNSILGTILNYEYYSKYLFRDAITGAYQEKVTDDSNLINLDTESFNLLFNLVAYMAGQQQQGSNALGYDAVFFKNEYDKGIIKYKSLYKSELQKPQSTYYKESNTSYRRIIGRGFGN